ncbi:FKBP-type peptidyl-prolyl cis-trans isomerase [Maribacter chungangensis]|uniref:Peptidyl-prolyl cis-trans isomerase n=1 Tax=Maribacter chungangensis TaxID=1069117 RepID=A0ABW3AZW5_9FLAO
MQKSILVIAALFIAANSFAQKKKDLIAEIEDLKAKATEMQARLNEIAKSKELNLQDSLQRFSYAFGTSIGSNLKTVGFDSLSYNAFAAALEDAIKGREKMTMQDAQMLIKTTIQAKQAEIAEAQSKEGELFLADNGKRPEVVTTESGLQYEILQQGDGPLPTTSDKVKVHYTGTLIDGSVFDSSIERGEPTTFGVSQVISGWTEALLLMPVGSKWKVFIPQDLAYGPRGAGGGEIPPYAALIFEMELLGIE